MSDTRIADVLDELHDMLAAETTLAAAVTAQTLKIFDGPPAVDFSGQSMLVVGGHPLVDDESEIAVTWDWAGMGRSGTFTDVDEWIDVPCGIASYGGDSTTMRDVRRIAIELYAKAASAIRGDSLSIAVPQVMWGSCAVSSIKQLQTSSGAECIVLFIARIRTRI